MLYSQEKETDNMKPTKFLKAKCKEKKTTVFFFRRKEFV